MKNIAHNSIKTPPSIKASSFFIWVYCLAYSASFTFASYAIQPDHAWFSRKELKTDFKSMSHMALNSPDIETRSKALEFLILHEPYRIQSADIFFKISETDDEIQIRKIAASALSGLGDQRAIAPLKKIMDKVNDVKSKLDCAWALNTVNDFSGFKYVIEANRSTNLEDRLYSSNVTKHFARNRKKILEIYQVDVLDELLRFSKDSEPEIRDALISYWPYNPKNFLFPEGGIPEDMQKKFIRTIRTLAENDPELDIRRHAKRKLKTLQ